MYEPKFIPQLKEFPLTLQNARFYVEHSSSFISPNDPDLDQLHLHNYTEFIVYFKGDMSFLVNNRFYALKKGDVVISKPNEIHVGIFQKEEEYDYFCVWIDEQETSPLLAFLKNVSSSVLSFDEDTANKTYALLSSIVDENTSPLQQTANFLQFLLLLQHVPDNAEPKKLLPQQLQNILNDIHNNASEIPHVQDLLPRHFVSHSTLNRWFQTYLHISPHAFLESEKLALAAKLLAAGVTVTEACDKSGFSDCSYFIALFKKKFGETPLKYKRRFQ